MKYKVFLSIGSNIEPRENIKEGLSILSERINLSRISRVYRTKPVGMKENTPEFHNLCVLIQTDLEPSKLKALLQQIEYARGRTRDPDSSTYQSRTLDIDILDYIPRPEGFKPHAEMLEQAFVVFPLSELTEPPDLDDFPDSVDEWRGNCDGEVILGIEKYDWSALGNIDH